ncbi:inositol monophosphatase [Candidatus Parcubacteria bacterium]|nr:MAG: inositol monophosphatase [Candidatus Parcubacteria bacterium]
MEKIICIPSYGYLIKLAEEAGKMILKGFTQGLKKEWKDDGTPVTEIDQKINDLVLSRFKRDFPEISVYSEEGSREVRGSDFKIICDPLDGTSAFLGGIPESTFCISLVVGGSPFLAVIYDPFLKRMWWAEKDKGAFLNGKKIQVSGHKELKKSIVCIAYWNKAPYHLHLVSNELMKQGATWMSPLSIAYFGGLVASGQIHATIFPGNKPLETAAMHLLVEEAGGKATDILGKPLVYDDGINDGIIEGHIISNGVFHDELQQIIEHVSVKESLNTLGYDR